MGCAAQGIPGAEVLTPLPGGHPGLVAATEKAILERRSRLAAMRAETALAEALAAARAELWADGDDKAIGPLAALAVLIKHVKTEEKTT